MHTQTETPAIQVNHSRNRSNKINKPVEMKRFELRSSFNSLMKYGTGSSERTQNTMVSSRPACLSGVSTDS
ncbi:MAG: hypothetical protein R3C20_16060 [Planctomycetaceae bacterium]